MKINRLLISLCFAVNFFFCPQSIAANTPGIVVFQSDFGLRDGAVSEVKGVMYSVDKSLIISDLTHLIPPYNIWDASYWLYQTATYWPPKTVFVSVVDPGVGTKRRSVVALTQNDYYFVTPDNGTLTLIADTYGIKEVRSIDEKKHRLTGSADSYTFFGRDVYGYTAAKLASGKISFQDVGPVLKSPVIKLPYQKAQLTNSQLEGTVVAIDPNYGNVWTNISKSLIKEAGLQANQEYQVKIYHNKIEQYSDKIILQHTFGQIPVGKNLMYLNSLSCLSLAINQGSFVKKYDIGSGPEWTIVINK